MDWGDLLSKLESFIVVVAIISVMLIGGSGAYYTIQYENVVANSKNLKGTSSSDELKKYGQVTNVSSNLAIREGPSTDSNTDYVLYEGMTFEILERDDSWIKIDYNGIIGYVNKEYLTEYDDTPPEEVFKDYLINIDDKKTLTPIKAELTAYCDCEICSEEWGSITAMQTHTQIGVIAAPKNIPLGSKMFIPDLKYYKSDGVFNVEDRGGAIKVKDDGTYIIDIWLPTHSEVKEFGRKNSVIYLLE